MSAATDAHAHRPRDAAPVIPDALYSVSETAIRLRCSDATVWRHLRDGSLEGVHVGALRRIRGSAILRAIAEGLGTPRRP